MTLPGPLNPPPRLLMGPGPIDADPRVLRAMSAPLVGQYDPFMTHAMNEVQELYRRVFVSSYQETLLVDSTARGAIEAALVSVLEPGDRVLVPVMGRFGHLLVEIAQRCGAEVHTVQIEWGQIAPYELIADAMAKVQPKLLAVVHGDTSTTVVQPFDGLAELCARYGTLLYADVTASIGGNEFLTEEWGVDIATGGLQKCLGGPSGSAPATFSPRAVGIINSRKSIEAGIRAEGDAVAAHPIRSNYFDMSMVFDYWSERRLNHHTEATTMLYAAREAARIVLEEGLEAFQARHLLHGRAMLAGVQGLGLEVFGDLEHKMTNIVGVVIPDGVDGEAVRGRMLQDFGIEIGTSFGPLQGKVWRIGTMGFNARQDAVLTTLAALEAVLRREGFGLPAGGGVDEAYRVYAEAAA
ncbi:pyridoxal-phosphate-dependent aminotransferase family protein [Demequina zhanjiangensis]|uniref:Alanine--glyoxylate aminotransferase family protein n=1 Tax=Demequina zhanjiangensis TaxID=3051659 RepID=A0ABT8FY39_9MICO|nr:alanine--glyoxylate aminotransferase family protein [Demequina sp. SYSU T00b26]MDN4471823.1 alanine--glyoxylate aminotransferase family protein [Demequina sp. SYSU T00b26]